MFDDLLKDSFETLSDLPKEVGMEAIEQIKGGNHSKISNNNRMIVNHTNNGWNNFMAVHQDNN